MTTTRESWQGLTHASASSHAGDSVFMRIVHCGEIHMPLYASSWNRIPATPDLMGCRKGSSSYSYPPRVVEAGRSPSGFMKYLPPTTSRDHQVQDW